MLTNYSYNIQPETCSTITISDDDILIDNIIRFRYDLFEVSRIFWTEPPPCRRLTSTAEIQSIEPHYDQTQAEELHQGKLTLQSDKFQPSYDNHQQYFAHDVLKKHFVDAFLLVIFKSRSKFSNNRPLLSFQSKNPRKILVVWHNSNQK